MIAKNYKDFSKVCKFSASKSWARSIVLLIQFGVVGCADRGQIEKEVVQKENIVNEQKKSQKTGSCELSGEKKEDLSQRNFHELNSEHQWERVKSVVDRLKKRYDTLKGKELTLSSETLERYSEEILKAQSDTEKILAAYRKFYGKNRSNEELDTESLWGELSLLHNSAAASANEISKLIDRLKDSKELEKKLEEKWNKTQLIVNKLIERQSNLKDRESRLSSEILEEHHRTKISEVHSDVEKALAAYRKFYDKNRSNKELGAENLLEGLRPFRKNMATLVNEMSEILNKLKPPKATDSNCKSPKRSPGNNVDMDLTPVRNNKSCPSVPRQSSGEIRQSNTEETESISQPESHGSSMSSRNRESDDNSHSSLRSNATDLIEEAEGASVKSQRSLNNSQKTLETLETLERLKKERLETSETSRRSTKKTRLRLLRWPITGVSNKKGKTQ